MDLKSGLRHKRREEEDPKRQNLFKLARVLPYLSVVLAQKGFTEKALRGANKKYYLNFFNFCKNDYNSAKDTEFLAKSDFNINSSANFGPSMTNYGALESWHQMEFVLDLLVGFRWAYKNKLLDQGKQTVQ